MIISTSAIKFVSAFAVFAVAGTIGGSIQDRPTGKEIAMTITEPDPSIKALVLLNEEKPKEKKYKKNEQLSPKELKQILYDVGFRGEALKIAWGTAMKESTGRPRSHNDNPATGDNSYGLFQINMIGDLGPARRKQFNLESNEDLFDPVRNAEIAFFMSNKGKNWSSWNGVTERTQFFMSKFPD